jgi:hypothetical protein
MASGAVAVGEADAVAAAGVGDVAVCRMGVVVSLAVELLQPVMIEMTRTIAKVR